MTYAFWETPDTSVLLLTIFCFFWFIRRLNSILECFRFYFFSLMSCLHPPRSGWEVIHSTDTDQASSMCQALSQFWGHNVMQIRETPCPSWALHSSREEKKQTETPINEDKVGLYVSWKNKADYGKRSWWWLSSRARSYICWLIQLPPLSPCSANTPHHLKQE